MSPKPTVTSDIETAVKSASRSERGHGHRLRRNRREEQDPDAGAPADAVDEADPERAQRRPHLVAMLLLGVRMRVQVEVAVSPADEETKREEDDQRGDGGLRALLDPLGKVALGEEDRHAEDDEGDAVPDSPPGTERRGRPGGSLAARGDERRHRRDVVRIGRVA